MNNVRLSEITKVVAGQAAPKDEYFGTSGYPFIRAGHLEGLINDLSESSLPKVDVVNANKLRLKLIPANTILFAKSGMSAMKNRIYRTCFPAFIVSHLAAILPSDKFHSSYLEYFLKWFGPSRIILDDSYPSIRLSDIEKIEIPLPPLETQKRIAAILDKADELRRNDQMILKKYDQLAQSVFLEMFGDFEANPFRFKQFELGEIVIKKGGIKCGPFGSQLKIEEYVPEGIPVYGIDNVLRNQFVEAKPKFITEGKFKYLNSFSVQANDILVTRTGTVGRACVAPPNIPRAIIGPNLLKIRLDGNDLLLTFLSFAFNYSQSIIRQIEMLSPGATVAVYNTSNLKKLKLLVPPIGTQKSFEKIYKHIETQKQLTQQSLQKSEELFQSLLQRAFKPTGGNEDGGWGEIGIEMKRN